MAIQQFAYRHQVGLITAKDQYIFIEKYNHYADMEYTVKNMTVMKVENILNINSNCLPKIILFDSTNKMIEVFHHAKEVFGDRYSITRSNNNYVEFMPQHVSKESALQYLSKIIKIPLANMIACGDSFNDITMLQRVGMGIAMGNAVEEVKLIAKEVTDSNDNDGIVKVIKKHFH